MSAVELAAAKGRPHGWWGMALFAATEATLFGTIIGSYFYLRFNSPAWPPLGVPEPTVLAPAVVTLVLAATTLPFGAALAAARAARRGRCLGLLLFASAVQAGYLGFQIHLLQQDLGHFTPQGSAYGSIYYVLLGAALAHVALGLLLDAWLLMRVARGLTRYRVVAAAAIALYWYVVAALSVVVLLTQLSPRL